MFTSPSFTGTGAQLALENVSRRFQPKKDVLTSMAQRWGLAKPTPVVHAVDNVSLEIKTGEVIGLVGESGCGKSTLGRIAAGIIKPSEGIVRVGGIDESLASRGAASTLEHLSVQMIFQDPFASLNPRMRVMDIIGEAARVHKIPGAEHYEDYVAAQMKRAGLDPSYMRRYPHQFSGGQRQRIGIARALAVNPRFIVCDESVAALDVSIQAQVLNLFMDLRDELGLTYLFISHDLSVVEHISDRVAIMYLGRIVEQGSKAELFSRPNHPYTQALLAEVPTLNANKRTFTAIKGEIPSPINPPSGCHFHPRCPHAMPRCREEKPGLKEVSPEHLSACHLNT
ncbi:ABC transporter ATP-binding protein [Pseudomonas vancouverensis]|uniref:ABC-type dipeptide transporter n=1 Tax=Pseudomonas vancouverensis TaxID=95300 RepID=A0A4R4JT68_PSEVA|nr:ATP-binding cassette domain-containing protein [Pseudomonas vancouverensis]TDB57830.1 ATP-binding cassette domain-containing protein [Pseudomonas vancouverensis]